VSSHFRNTSASMGATLARVGLKQHTKPIADMQKRLNGRDTDTLRVNVIGWYTSPIGAQYIVLESGKKYHLNRFLLNHLRESGETCESLEIIPADDEEEV